MWYSTRYPLIACMCTFDHFLTLTLILYEQQTCQLQLSNQDKTYNIE